MVRNGRDHLVHQTLKSGVSKEWVHEFSWFFCMETEAVIFSYRPGIFWGRYHLEREKNHYAHCLGISLKVSKSRGRWSGEVALIKYHIRLRGACNNWKYSKVENRNLLANFSHSDLSGKLKIMKTKFQNKCWRQRLSKKSKNLSIFL